MDFSNLLSGDEQDTPSTDASGGPPPPPPRQPTNPMSFAFLDSTGIATPSYSFEGSPLISEEHGSFSAGQEGEQQLSGGEDDLRRDAEQAATAALFSGLGGGLSGQGLDGLDAFLDPALGGFTSPQPHLEGLELPPAHLLPAEHLGTSSTEQGQEVQATLSAIFAGESVVVSDEERTAASGATSGGTDTGEESLVDIMGGAEERTAVDALRVGLPLFLLAFSSL